MLLLDELAEFYRPALEALRQPLESARLAVRELDQKALAQVLADWIDARVSI